MRHHQRGARGAAALRFETSLRPAQRIATAAKEAGGHDQPGTFLKRVKDRLPAEYDYGSVQLALSHLQRRRREHARATLVPAQRTASAATSSPFFRPTPSLSPSLAAFVPFPPPAAPGPADGLDDFLPKRAKSE